MAEQPHAEAGNAKEHKTKSGLTLGGQIKNIITGTIRKRFGGYWRKAAEEPDESTETSVEKELAQEGSFEILDAIGEELGKIIELGWEKTEALNKEVEELYTGSWDIHPSDNKPKPKGGGISVYNSFVQINKEYPVDRELIWTEKGTNVVSSQQRNVKIEYKYPKPASKELELDGKKFIRVNELIAHLENNKARLKPNFEEIRQKIAEWITKECNIKFLENNIKEKTTLDDLIELLKYPSTFSISYTPLKIEPVAILNYEGGGIKKPKPNPKLLVTNTKLNVNTLIRLYVYAKKRAADFESDFINNEANKEILIDWVQKELDLRLLALKISKIRSAKEFVELFPTNAPMEYKEPEYVETVAFFGKQTKGDITGPLDKLQKLLLSTTVPTDVSIDNLKKELASDNGSMSQFIELFNTVINCEEELHQRLSRLKPLVSKVDGYFDDMWKQNRMPGHLHFKHTYEIIKRWHMPIFGGTEIKYFGDEHPEFKREEEQEPGFDERGMPLEIYEQDKRYYVLVDHWFSKIAENPWQMEQIASKQWTREGVERLFKDRANFKGILTLKDGSEKEFNFKISQLYNKGLGRNVKPEFKQKLDPLEAVTYLNTNWDAYRDDFRDGRYHKYSKTYYDYVLAAHMYHPVTKQFKGIRHMLFGVVMPIKEIIVGHGEMAEFNPDPWKRVPVHGTVLGKDKDEKLEKDERKVKGNFVLEFIDKDNKEKELRPDKVSELRSKDKGKEEYTRRPAHMNPAFDRIALRIYAKGLKSKKGHDDNVGKNNAAPAEEEKELKPWVHWGRMYYYEDTEGINKYSENPDPAISTRGMAKYLIDRVVRLAYTQDDARKMLRGHPYDFGIRSQAYEMPDDPLGGADKLLRFGKYLKEKNIPKIRYS